MTPPRHKKRGGWSKGRQAALRLAELSRLSVFRQKHGLADPIRPLLFLGCDALSLLKHGADWQTVNDWLKRIGRQDHIAEPDIMSCIHKVSVFRATAPRASVINRVTAGQLLDLTSAEHDELHLVTLQPGDEDEQARKSRVKIARRVRDAARRRQKRRAEGMRTREDYLATSLTASRPWELEGITRRTWERRRVRVASLSSHLTRDLLSADKLATVVDQSVGDVISHDRIQPDQSPSRTPLVRSTPAPTL